MDPIQNDGAQVPGGDQPQDDGMNPNPVAPTPDAAPMGDAPATPEVPTEGGETPEEPQM